MKRLAKTALALLLTACGSDDPAKETSAPSPDQAAVSAPQTATANLDQLPVSTKDLGVFPFFNLPDGFKAQDIRDQQLETKYVFPNGGLLSVEGRYHHARVFSSDDNWNETLLLRSFDEKIRELGGVQVYDGGLPDTARDKIANDKPRFVADLYDPSPYRFRQYVIRTPQGRVWVEIGYGYNAPMADLTIVQEGELRQTITQVTADQIDRDLKAAGKAVLHINFDTDRATLKADGTAAVSQIAALLKSQPELKLSIEGHTDDTGSPQRNSALSLDRAKAVQTALVQAGIAADRLQAVGYGADRPIAGNATEAEKAQNRRVELVRR